MNSDVQCCGPEMFIPDSDFFPRPGSKTKKKEGEKLASYLLLQQ
jgi:hypothetical protein